MNRNQIETTGQTSRVAVRLTDAEIAKALAHYERHMLKTSRVIGKVTRGDESYTVLKDGTIVRDRFEVAA